MTDAIPDGHSQHCPRRSARRDVVLWAVLVASFGIKAGLVAATHDSPLVLDETEYVQQARTIAQQGRYVGTFRPPLYSASLAGVLLLGGTLVHVKLAQVLLSTLTVVFVHRMARRTVGLQAARAAAVLCALDPVLITFTHHIWSETVYIFLFAATADLMTSDVTWRHRWPWLIVGALLGLAGLTRPMILSFAPLMVVWTLLQTHRQADPGPAHAESTTTRKWPTGFMRIALLTLGCILIVLPWTLRNARVTGAFVLVDTNGPFNLLVGSQRAAAFVDKDDFWSFRYGQVGGTQYRQADLEDPAGAQRQAMKQAWSRISAAPGAYLRRCLWESAHLWTVDSFLLRHLRNGWYGTAPASSTNRCLTALSVGFNVLLIGAALLGLTILPASPMRGLIVLLCVHATLLFGLTYSLSRYNLPLHPFLAIPAGAVLVRIRKSLADLIGPKCTHLRRIVGGLAMVGLLCSWNRDLPLVKDMWRTGGTHYRFRMVLPGRRHGLGPEDQRSTVPPVRMAELDDYIRHPPSLDRTWPGKLDT